MQTLEIQLSAWAPNLNSIIYRKAPREPVARTGDYEDRYDFSTIFYDVFWMPSGTEVMMVAPPFLSLEGLIKEASFVAEPSGTMCNWKDARTGPIHNLMLPVPSGTTHLVIRHALGDRHVAIQPSLVSAFRGKRVILTQSKNNPLHWIRDWVYYYVKAHGSNALVLYDNASELYSVTDIREALLGIPGLEQVLIIDWPFPFGPPPSLFNVNDSRYLQRGMLEHARYRLLSEAASLFHNDIDEIILGLDGTSIHEACENSSTGYLSFTGRWIERVTEDGVLEPVDQITHRTYKFLKKPGGRTSAEKLCVSPNRHGARVYWTTHRAYGVAPDVQASSRFEHRHLFGLKTEATDERNVARLEKNPVVRFDPDKHEEDVALSAALSAVFDTREYASLPKVPAYRFDRSGDIRRVLAGKAMKVGDVSGALFQVEKALDHHPDYPSYHLFKAKCLRMLDQHDEARRAEEEAERIRSQDSRYLLYIVKQARLDGRSEDATAIMEGLLARNAAEPEFHFAHGELLSTRRLYSEAADAFQRAIDLGLATIEVFWRKGLDAARAGRYQEAIAAYSLMRQAGPVSFEDWMKYYRGLIDAHERAREDEQVAQLAHEAIERLGTHAKMTAATLREIKAKLNAT